MISISLWKLERLMIKSPNVLDSLSGRIKDQSRVGNFGQVSDGRRVDWLSTRKNSLLIRIGTAISVPNRA